MALNSAENAENADVSASADHGLPAGAAVPFGGIQSRRSNASMSSDEPSRVSQW